MPLRSFRLSLPPSPQLPWQAAAALRRQRQAEAGGAAGPWPPPKGSLLRYIGHDDEGRAPDQEDEYLAALEGLSEPEQVEALAKHVAEQKALLQQKMDFVQQQLAQLTDLKASCQAELDEALANGGDDYEYGDGGLGEDGAYDLSEPSVAA